MPTGPKPTRPDLRQQTSADRPWRVYGKFETVVEALFPASTPPEILSWAYKYAALYSDAVSTDDRTLPMKGKWPAGLYVGEEFVTVTDLWLHDSAERICYSIMRRQARARKGWGMVHGGGSCYMSQRRLAMDMGVSVYKVRRVLHDLRTRTYQPVDEANRPAGDEKRLIIPEGSDVWNHRIYMVAGWQGLLPGETYLIVPLWLIRRWELESHDKLVWACLRDNAQPIRNGSKNPYGAGYACLQQRRIAARVGITRDMVKDSLQLLRQLRLIEYLGPSRPGGPSVYHLLDHPWRRHYLTARRNIREDEDLAVFVESLRDTGTE